MRIEGEGTVNFVIGNVAKKVLSFRVRCRKSQLEAEKMPAKPELKVAENRVKPEKTTDRLAKGTMNRFATTTIMGTILK